MLHCTALSIADARPCAGMLTPATLLDLLEQDVGTRILEHLPLKALASLATTCWRVRAQLGVQDADPVWRQAAQLSGYSASHPVHAASSVTAYLRQQHFVHRNITSGRCTVRHFLPPQPCLVAPDCAKYAFKDAGDRLLAICVGNLQTRLTLQRWPLREHLPSCGALQASKWRWDLDSRVLAVPTAGCGAGTHTPPRLLLLDTQTGSFVGCLLEEHFFPVTLGPWSRDSLLVVRCRSSFANLASYKIFGLDGFQVAQTSVLGGDVGATVGAWAPAGQARLLVHGRYTCWLWELGAPVQQVLGSAGLQAWCPVSGSLIYAPQLFQGGHRVWCGQLGAAVISGYQDPELLLFALSSQQPQLVRRIRLGGMHSVVRYGTSIFSPDGAHRAAFLEAYPYFQVIVGSFTTGHIFRDQTELVYRDLQWCSNGRSLLAWVDTGPGTTSTDTPHALHVLVDFS